MQVGRSGVPAGFSAASASFPLSPSVVCSVVGNAEPQHPGDGDHRGAVPPRQPRVLVHAQPGTQAPPPRTDAPAPLLDRS